MIEHGIKRGDIELLEELIKYNNIEWKNCDGMTAFMIAGKYGNLNILTYLRKIGANVLVLDNAGRNTLWHYMCCSKNRNTFDKEVMMYIASVMNVEPSYIPTLQEENASGDFYGL